MKIEIEENLISSFKRVISNVPSKLRKNKHVIETTAAYFKLGGERLARHSVEVFKAIDNLERGKRKKKLREEALLKAAEVRRKKESNENKNKININTNNSSNLKTE